MGCLTVNVSDQIGCNINCVCLISKIILVCAKTLYISSNLVILYRSVVKTHLNNYSNCFICLQVKQSEWVYGR